MRRLSGETTLWVSMPFAVAIVALVLAAPAGKAATVVFQVTVPDATPQDAVVHLAGDFQGWNPGAGPWALTRSPDGIRQITCTFNEGQPLQFKFTLGSWQSVEKGAQGEEISNRLYVARADTTLELEVANWADGSPPSDTMTGDVSLLDVPGFLDGRRIWVYLPPGYHDDAPRRYPVLYMLDGQNVFNNATSFAGEWKVDESLAVLIAAGEVESLIVVAIANGGEDRSFEYTPWINSNWNGRTGGGGAHLEAIIDIVKPVVDGRFRTLQGPAHTGLAGSSLGGLMGLYAGWEHPDVFGLIASLSPTLFWADAAPRRQVETRERPAVKLYVDMGTREQGNLRDGDGNGVDDAIDDLRALKAALVHAGFESGRDLLVVEDEGARHNEEFWARRFPAALRFLFPGAEMRRAP